MSSTASPFSLKKALATSVFLICLTSMLSIEAFAWGDKGHRIVARIAASRLTPKARAAIADLIGQDEFLAECKQNHIPTTTLADKFACISVWADKVRNNRPETRQWHFVDIPRNAESYLASRDCPPSADGDCVIQEIERAFAVLSNPQAAKTERAEALKFIVHFVGDMHQPLHDATDTEDQEAKANGFETDRGGNQKFVTWLGQKTNEFGNWQLHAVWDSGIIDATTNNERSFASTLASQLTQAQKSFTRPSAPNANWPATLPNLLIPWANEGHDLAVSNAYKIGQQFPNDVAVDKGKSYHRYHLGNSYLKANRPVFKAAHDLHDRIGLAYVGEKLVAQSLAL